MRTDDRMVTVCDQCETAGCWYGEFMCEDAKTAGTKEMPISELRKLALEHEDNWTAERVAGK